ncbi:MAG: NeuD/PglB/VioB family sugar acetyltransferase [Thermoleophilia bacterium]
MARILAPLVNTNEREARVVEIAVAPYSRVRRGEVICVLETSKATAEVEAGADGWIGPIHVALLDDVSAGTLLCEIFESAPARDAAADGGGGRAGGSGHRLTKKAAALAAEAGVDLSSLPTDRFLTEQDVRVLIARSGGGPEIPAAVRDAISPGSVVVFGGGGLGKCLIECLRYMDGLHPLCVIDDGLPAGGDVAGVPVAGGRSSMAALAEAGARLAVNGIGAIGRMKGRVDIYELIRGHGFEMPVTIDKGAVVTGTATLADGVQVHPGAVIAAAAAIGPDTIVNTGTIISHDCVVGAHCHLAPGATLAGHVTVGDEALVGMGATIALGLSIGARAIVGNGAVVNADVPDGAVVAAGSVWGG